MIDYNIEIRVDETPASWKGEPPLMKYVLFQ